MAEEDVMRLIDNMSESLQKEMGDMREEMRAGFGQVNQRLDRIDATLTLHGKQIAAGTRAIASLVRFQY